MSLCIMVRMTHSDLLGPRTGCIDLYVFRVEASSVFFANSGGDTSPQNLSRPLLSDNLHYVISAITQKPRLYLGLKVVPSPKSPNVSGKPTVGTREPPYALPRETVPMLCATSGDRLRRSPMHPPAKHVHGNSHPIIQVTARSDARSESLGLNELRQP